MAENRRCPKCGAELSPGAADGLCPRCLIQAGFESATLPRNAYFASEGSFSQSPTIIDEPLPPHELAQLLPQFEILELLGRGGMGAVYKARQLNLDRIVALKVIRPNLAKDPGFTERFSREAHALARLSHQSIVTVHDFGQTAGLCYLVMEFVDGVNLRTLIRDGQLTSDQALCIVPEICEALQFAHDEGIVHRDIKPENILIDKRGRVKIADFGLAKLLGTAQENVTLTGTGQFMGTVGYMAPEQFQQPNTVDHRADIYSLGAVFYEMLTGQLPIGRFQPPSKKVQIDVRLDEVVLRSLESEPDRRYQRASDVKTDVDEIRLKVAPNVVRYAPKAVAGAHHADVRAPAVGLLITGAMQAASLLLILGYFGFSSRMHGIGALELLIVLAGPVLFGVLILIGAVKMLNMKSYGWAMAASILALIPVGPSCLLSLPMGIWALVVLSRQDVKAAFDENQRRRSLDPVHAANAGRVSAPRVAAIEARDARFERLAMVCCFGGIVAGIAIALMTPILDQVAVYLAFVVFVLSQIAGFILGLIARRRPMGKKIVITSLLMLLVLVPMVWLKSSRTIKRPAQPYQTTTTITHVPVRSPTMLGQGQKSERWGWEMGPNGPQLNGRTAITIRRDQVESVNRVLQEMYRQYLAVEKKYSEQSTDKDGHQITTIQPITSELLKLEGDLWSKLDPLLDPQQQNIFRLNLLLVPQDVFGTSPTMHEMVKPGLFGWGKQSARIEIWREGTWYRWVVRTDHGSHPEEKSRTPELPEEYRRFWKDQAEKTDPPAAAPTAN